MKRKKEKKDKKQIKKKKEKKLYDKNKNKNFCTSKNKLSNAGLDNKAIERIAELTEKLNKEVVDIISPLKLKKNLDAGFTSDF